MNVNPSMDTGFNVNNISPVDNSNVNTGVNGMMPEGNVNSNMGGSYTQNMNMENGFANMGGVNANVNPTPSVSANNGTSEAFFIPASEQTPKIEPREVVIPNMESGIPSPVVEPTPVVGPTPGVTPVVSTPVGTPEVNMNSNVVNPAVNSTPVNNQMNFSETTTPMQDVNPAVSFAPNMQTGMNQTPIAPTPVVPTPVAPTANVAINTTNSTPNMNSQPAFNMDGMVNNMQPNVNPNPNMGPSPVNTPSNQNVNMTPNFVTGSDANSGNNNPGNWQL